MIPDSKIHVAHVGPIWVLSAPGRPHTGPINLAIGDFLLIWQKNLSTSGWNCQPWPSRSQNWMFVYFIIILSRSQQFPTSSSQDQVELDEWGTGHFMHWNTGDFLGTILKTMNSFVYKKKRLKLPSFHSLFTMKKKQQSVITVTS